MKKDVQPEIKTLLSWVKEAHLGASAWRAESWRDQEMYDGGDAQWSQTDWDACDDAGIEQITINRTWPAINLLIGSQIINRFNILAKARTRQDAEMSQVMSEGIQFVLDQSNGQFLISDAFKDSTIPGFGCLATTLNPDPRKEKLGVAYRDWKEVWWDPFGSPWLEPNRCRYVLYQRWMDLSDLQALIPEKEKELKNKFDELSGYEKSEEGGYYDDQAMIVEEKKRLLAGNDWVSVERVRVRPVEIWYTIFKQSWFAIFPDGRVIELKDTIPYNEQFDIVRHSSEIAVANVRKMQTATFLGDLLLMQQPSPFPHDEYPLIPFIGYLDRYNYPYGVPRQIRGQDIEVNKRRSMALALLKSRRVIVEKDVVDGGEDGLNALYEEANKLDGFLVINSGKSGSIKIVEQGELATSQVALLQQSEREIEEGTGATAERAGYESKAISGKALEKKQIAAATITASLYDNLRRSTTMLGNQVGANMQGFWTGEKVLRITDRITGAEKFVAINKYIMGETGAITVQNNITQFKFDIVVAEAPQTDTIREQNMNLIIEWVKKSPPDVIPHLMNIAFELSNIPNKDQLLARIKPILGVDPRDEDLSAEEIKQKTVQELEAHQQQQAEQAQVAREATQLELEEKRLENDKLKAEIEQIITGGRVDRAKVVMRDKTDKAKIDVKREEVDVQRDELELEAFKVLTEPKGQERTIQ